VDGHAEGREKGAASVVITLGFWALLGLVLGCFVALLWVGPIPPLTDFGGHVQMIHAWRHADEPGWAELVIRHDSWWLPNVLLARVAAFLAPAMGEISALALLVSLAIVLTALGFVRLLRVSGRSPWLVFLVLPLFWNGVFVLGLVNYIAALAVLPWALSLAVEVSERVCVGERVETWRYVALSLLLVLAFFLHTFASLVIMGAVGLAFVVRVPWQRALALCLWLTPAMMLFGHWYLRMRGAMSELQTMTWPTPERAIGALATEFDVTTGALDVICAGISGVIAVLLLFANGGEPEVKARRVLPVIVAGMALAYFFILPEYVGDIFTGARIIAPMAWLAVIIPRANLDKMTHRILLGVGVVNALVAAISATATVHRFSQRELEPLVEIIEKIPRGVRAQCVGVRPYLEFPRRPPLDHNCNGLLTGLAEAFAGGGFANTDYNAVELRRPQPRLTDSTWTRAASLAQVDYVVSREIFESPPIKRVEKVAEIPISGGTARWVLYRFLGRPIREDTTLVPPIGGEGGVAFRRDCPAESTLERLDIATSGNSQSMNGLAIGCRDKSRRNPDDEQEIIGSRGKGLRSLRCGADQRVVGLAGRFAEVVTALGLICERAENRLRLPPSRTLVGSNHGTPFSLKCPEGTTLVGVHGRAGLAVDAIGLVCTELR
jgi:hypothetical protein